MPDICFDVMEGGEKVPEEAQEEMAVYQSYFFSEPEIDRKRKHAAENKGKKGKGSAGPKNPKIPACSAKLRQSAFFNIKAIDKMLKVMLGMGFAMFLASGADLCLAEMETFHPTLVLHLDEGSPGYAKIWFLMYGLPLRVMPMRDVFHREWNDARLGLSESHLWWIVQLTTVCVNLPFGPWDGSAWWEKVVGQAQDFAVRSNEFSPLYLSLYSLICTDLGEEAVGTIDHIRSVFKQMTDRGRFGKKGEKVSSRRWFGWCAGAAYLDKRWHSWLGVIIALGLQKGYYKNYQQVPLWRPSSVPVGSVEDVEVSGDEGEPGAMDEMHQAEVAAAAASSKDASVGNEDTKGPIAAQAHEQLAALRKKCLNTMFVCAAVLSKSGLQYCMRLVLTLVRAIWTEHSENARTIRGPDGARSFYVNAAAGHIFEVLNTMCEICQDVSLLGFCGFDVEFSTLELKKTKTADNQIQIQNQLASDLYNGLVALLKHRLTAMLWHIASWPGKLALFLQLDFGPDSQVLVDLLTDLRAFNEAVSQGAGSAWILKLIKSSPFQTWVMKDICNLLFGPDAGDLGEHARLNYGRELGWVLRKAQRVVWELFSGWGNTKIVEDHFKKMRERESKDNSNKRLAMQTYWAASSEMGAIELHERTQVDTSRVLADAPKLKKSIHGTKGHEISLPSASDIMKTQTWPSFTAQSSQQVPAALLLTAMTHKDESWESMSKAWLSVLFHSGMLVYHTPTDSYYIVLSDVGHLVILCWKVQRVPIKKTNYSYYVIGGKVEVNSTLFVFSASDLEVLKVVPAQAVSPAHLLLTLKKLSPDIGVVLMQTGGHLTVLQHVANNCFFKLTMPQLQKLSTHLKVPQPNPDMASHIRNLVKHVFPEITADRMEEILQMRSCRVVDPMEGLIPKEMEDEIFDKDDHSLYKDI